MLLIGMLEQLNLALVLQRIETHTKSGLLVVKQREQWIELYFQEGRLLCLGPVAESLGERLVRAGVISPQALQQTLRAIGDVQPPETRIAMALIDLGYASRETLRAWASREAVGVMQTLFSWSSGEVYFEEDIQPSVGRLLVSLSISSLLSSASAQATIAAPAVPKTTTTLLPNEPAPVTQELGPTNDVPLLSAAQLFSDSAVLPSIALAQEAAPVSGGLSLVAPETTTLTPPQPIANPFIPRRIDTSFMRPEMILVPADLAALREQNPRVPLTPEQWRVFAQANGSMSLQMVSQVLRLAPELICRVVGELIALGLVYLTMPGSGPLGGSSPNNGYAASGFSNGYVTPGYAAAPAQPWSAVMPATDVPGYPGGGRGQPYYSQPVPALQSSGPVYAANGGYGRGAGRY